MTCYRPLQGYWSAAKTEDGKRSIVFNVNDALTDRPLNVPCGKCTGCRLARSRDWAIRCSHEADSHACNSFLTLTYNAANLPKYGTLVPQDMRKFLGRLRDHLKPHRIRFFGCGEYGDQLSRPHYHICLFGFDFGADRVLFKRTRNGHGLYISPFLTKTWGKGHAVIGDLTFESAAYTARYVMKKQGGDNAPFHYAALDYSDGSIYSRVPEFVRMSLGRKDGPKGLGEQWIEKYWKDVYPSDEVTLLTPKGLKRWKPPRYYDKWLEKNQPDVYREVKRNRILFGKKHADDSRSSRLKVREDVAVAKLSRLPWELEEA